MTETLRLQAEWTDDCQGKKDYDGDILSISTRYWPRGGGFFVLRNAGDGVAFEENDARPYIKPSATSSLMLTYHKDGGGDYVDLTEQSFEGETFEEVAAQVEVWAQEQMDRAVRALRAEFPTHE
jgi:hypothetical protein